MNATTFRKGDRVLYDVRGQTYSARVERVHRDGSLTVKALFPVRDGEEMAGYLGYTYRHQDAAGFRRED